MCLIVKQGCKIEVASSDIVCKKLVIPTDNQEIWRGLYNYRFYAKFNKELAACEHLEIVKKNEVEIITSGFSAFLQEAEHEIDVRLDINNPNCTCVTAVIPKGAEYCLGEGNEIIASRMIIKNYNQSISPYLFHIKPGSEVNVVKENPITCRKFIIHRDENTWTTKSGIVYEYNKLQKSINRKTGIPGLYNHLMVIDNKIIKYGFSGYLRSSRKTELIEGEERYAVIPAGAEFCLGDNLDIIANQIIVFSSKEKYEDYVSKN